MKAELTQEIALITTPQELKKLADEWQKKIEDSNYTETGSILYKTFDRIRLTLRVDTKKYALETDKIVSNPLV